MNKRFQEIRDRVSELKDLITNSSDIEEVRKYRSELDALQTELTTLSSEEHAKREIEMKGKEIIMEKELSRKERLALAFGLVARKKMPTEEQKRALGVALTTTATSYVEADVSNNGVNNGGVMIATDILFDLLREEKLLTPILEDILFTNVKGLVKFPYRKSRDAAKKKIEGAAPGDNQEEWAVLEGAIGRLQITIKVTDELEEMTDIDFGQYIAAQIMQDLGEDWAEALIYGSGSNNEVKGATYQAKTTNIHNYTAGKELEVLEKALGLLAGSKRKGAKIYVSQSFFDALAFAKDDNGNYIYGPQGMGPKSFGNCPIVVDETLHAGDVLVGNVAKYFKVNLLTGMKFESDRDIEKGITTYVSKVSCAAAPVPNAFAYGDKAS